MKSQTRDTIVLSSIWISCSIATMLTNDTSIMVFAIIGTIAYGVTK